MKHEKIYLVTDGCAWEINRQNGNEHPHSIEVADLETGAIRYIRCGSRIAFLQGEITDIRTQKTYNEAQKMSADGQGDVSNKSSRRRKYKKPAKKVPPNETANISV